MANNYHGKTILGELMDDLTIDSVDSTQAVFVGKQTGGNLWVEIYCGTTPVVIEDDEVLEFYLQTCSSSTLGDHEAPISYANAGGQPNATGTVAHDATDVLNADEATYGVYIKAHTNGITYTTGDLIAEIGIPDTMMRLCGHEYVQLKMIETTTVAGTIDAFVVARV